MRKDYAALSDKELVKLLKSEKKESDDAFRAVYNRYSSRLHAYCMRILHDKQQSEDIFQETFIRFYQKVKADFNGGSIAGFLITIARNLCLNYKRDKKTTVPVEDFHIATESNVSDQREETAKLIRMAVDLLEDEYKEPLVLRLYDGMRYEEIAEICNISCDNARKRVFRAKQKIKDILNPYLKEIYG